MAKPSIFSNNYSSKMEKRKKRRTILIIIGIIVILFILLISNFRFNNIEAWTKNNSAYISSLFKGKTPIDKQKNYNTNANTNTNVVDSNTDEAVAAETGFDVALSNVTIKAIYQGKGDSFKFKYITPANSTNYYRISPNGKLMIIFDDKTQSIFLLDSTGKARDITMKNYISSSGTDFAKENVMEQTPTYIWTSSPTFIDDDSIAYISQVPYFDNDVAKYVWVYGIKDGSQFLRMELKGTDIKFGALTDKGLTVSIDGTTKYVDGTGKIISN